MRCFASKIRVALFLVLPILVFADERQSLRQQLLAQPPNVLVEEAERLSRRGISEHIVVDYLRADLDGSGKFDFIVAFYSSGSSEEDTPYGGAYFRVFKQQRSTLKFLGEQEDRFEHGRYGARVSLVDLNGDGIAEIEVDGHDASGQHEYSEFFGWTGTSLHLLTSEGACTCGVEDIDGDGLDELIEFTGENTWDVFKYDGLEYKLWKTFDSDPQGLFGANGKVQVIRAFLTAFRPDSFSLSEFTPSLPLERATVRLVLGDFRDLNGKLIAVDQIDNSTMFLGTNIRPTAINTRPATQEEIDADRAPDKPTHLSEILELEFTRTDISKLLPKLKLTAPLADGDELELKLRARTKAGTRVSAVCTVAITAKQH